jgi:hypothetical protein
LWGIGKTAPNAKLHINSLSTEDPFRVQVNDVTKLLVHRSGGVAIGRNSTPPANGLLVSGNVGIGTATPQQKLHVDGNEILSTGLSSGFKFRNRGSATNADDWVWYSLDNVTRLWRAGAGDLLSISTGGNVGIGTTPGLHKVKIAHGSSGLSLQYAATGNEWELWTADNTHGAPLDLYYNGIIKGTFHPFSGEYHSISDERLKSNIEVMPSILDKVNQLKPTTYQFKTADNTPEGNTPESYGFLAQDVQKIFPHLVTHHVVKERNLDTYTLNYNGFGVIAIKGIQELQQTIQGQENKISTLEGYIAKQDERIAKLEAALGAISNGFINLNNAELIGVSLEQNHPNPADQNTTFSYTIPAGANAQIRVYDTSSGKLVKTLVAPAEGKVQMNTTGLQPGNYIYTLMVNGKLTFSKQMILSK